MRVQTNAGEVELTAEMVRPGMVFRYAPLLGPRVGLRMRRPLARAMAAPFAFRMPSSGSAWVTFAAGEEPALYVPALAAAHLRKTFAERDHARFVEDVR